MSRLTSVTVLIALAVACAPQPEGADQVPDTNIVGTAQKDAHWDYASNPHVDPRIEPLLALAPGCAVGVMVDGEIDYLHGYGWAEAEKAPGLTTTYTELGGQDILDPNAAKADGEWHVGTTAAIGSVSKVFTATAAVRLARDLDSGVTMNTTVGEALGSDGAMGDLTLSQLLSHAKAVGVTTESIEEMKNEAFAPTFAFAPAQDATHPMQHPRLAFAYYEDEPVGSTPSYSNVGYAAAGAIIDDWAAANSTTYGSYERWVWSNVGHPYPSAFHSDSMDSLALTHSWRDGDIPNYAHGYSPMFVDGDWTGWSRFDAWEGTVDASSCGAYPDDDAGCVAAYEGWEGPAGGWTLTIGDLTRLLVAFENDALVTEPTFRQMSEARTFLHGLGDYGWGLQVLKELGPELPDDGIVGNEQLDRGAIVGHGGHIAGHMALVRYWPGVGKGGIPELDGFGVTIICNSHGAIYSEMGAAADDLWTAYTEAGLLDPDGPDLGNKWSSPAPEAPIPAPDLGDRLLAVDLSRAYLTSPEDLSLPLLPGDTVPLLAVSGSKSGVALRMGAGQVGSGRAVQDTSVAVLELGTDAFRANPAVSGSSKGTWKLPTDYGTIVLEDVGVSGSFVERGAHLVAMELTGRLDVRSVALFGRDDREEICRIYGEEGACEPCADGAAQCLPVTVSGLKASEVSGTLR